MSCEFAHLDGAYVLGALSPTERVAFKQHLAGCEECSRSVTAMAGLPGLLGRVDAEVLEEMPDEEPPATLLPALLAEVRNRRRRRTLTTAGLAAAAALVVGVPLAAWQVGDEPPAAPPSSEVSDAPVAETPMEPVGQVPVQATVSLEEVTWGTRLGLTCTYDADWVEGDLPREADYELYVRAGGERWERVGSWKSVDGTEMHIVAATATARDDLESVEVRTTDGRVVLRLGA